MNIHELIAHQRMWEAARRIENPDYNLHRAQVELDEAKEEGDPYAKLIEIADTFIILSGGAAKLCDELGLPYEQINELIKMKLEINDRKYPVSIVDRFPDMAAYIAHCRACYSQGVDPIEALTKTV